MPRRRILPVLLAASSLLSACDYNEYLGTQGFGGGATGASFSFSDPTGDYLPGITSSTTPDATSISGTLGADTLTIRLGFRNAIARFSAGAANSLDGFLDLDMDENATTGIMSAIDEAGGASGVGADFYLDLRDASSGTIYLIDANNSQPTPVAATFGTNSLTVRIPRTLLRDTDDRFRMSALIVSGDVPADFVPNAGFLTVAP